MVRSAYNNFVARFMRLKRNSGSKQTTKMAQAAAAWRKLKKGSKRAVGRTSRGMSSIISRVRAALRRRLGRGIGGTMLGGVKLGGRRRSPVRRKSPVRRGRGRGGMMLAGNLYY